MPRRRRTRLPWAAAGLLLALAVSGCGGGESKVRGKVTHNGKAVVWGSVTLQDQRGAVHQATIDLNGNYEIDKVPVGPVKIAVVSPKPAAGRAKGEKDAKDAKGGKGGEIDDPREQFFKGKEKESAPERPLPPPGAWFPIPDKYASTETSGLTGEVKPKETELNIEIK
jgi:hypothetical protein